jgi:mRNA-decapping enzyme subunit 2
MSNQTKEKSKQEYNQVLEDICSRFLLNCPEEEYDSFERLFFQIEEAHWFYSDVRIFFKI